jgi:hypothetical protein
METLFPSYVDAPINRFIVHNQQECENCIMTLREFIKQNRREIDECINKQLKTWNQFSRNDEERRQWILNDEGLYNWARSAGCRI